MILNSADNLIPGAVFGGGFVGGFFMLPSVLYAVIFAPKAEGEHDDTEWNDGNYKNVTGALSFIDGLANTQAMAKAGSKLAKWAMGLRIGGYDDWHLPALDQLEMGYRLLKPGTVKNWCYMRSGINLHSEPIAHPYTPELPAQTEVAAFQKGGAEAFDECWYWSSTQHASNAGDAWAQHFLNGGQNDYHKTHAYRARAVRIVKI